MKSKLPLSNLSQAGAEWLTQTLADRGHLLRGRVARVIRDIWMQSNYSIIGRLQVSYSPDAAGEATATARATPSFGRAGSRSTAASPRG